MWLYLDSIGRVISACPDDMAGNTGWEFVEVPNNFDMNILWDNHEAAMYMVEDGILIARTLDERMADWSDDTTIEPAVNIHQLRADVDYIAMETGVELW